MVTYTDATPMPFGKHKGVALANVPADYLLWLHKDGCQNGALKTYIKENLDALKAEVVKTKKAVRHMAK